MGPNAGSKNTQKLLAVRTDMLVCVCVHVCVCAAEELDHPCQEHPTIVLTQPCIKTINVLYRAMQITVAADRDRSCLKDTSLMC